MPVPHRPSSARSHGARPLALAASLAVALLACGQARAAVAAYQRTATLSYFKVARAYPSAHAPLRTNMYVECSIIYKM